MHEAIDNVWHVSNLYQIPEQQILAKKLCDISFADKVFFLFWAEAVEGAIKTSWKYHLKKVIKIGQRSLLSKMHSMAGL